MKTGENPVFGNQEPIGVMFLKIAASAGEGHLLLTSLYENGKTNGETSGSYFRGVSPSVGNCYFLLTS